MILKLYFIEYSKYMRTLNIYIPDRPREYITSHEKMTKLSGKVKRSEASAKTAELD